MEMPRNRYFFSSLPPRADFLHCSVPDVAGCRPIFGEVTTNARDHIAASHRRKVGTVEDWEGEDEKHT